MPKIHYDHSDYHDHVQKTYYNHDHVQKKQNDREDHNDHHNLLVHIDHQNHVPKINHHDYQVHNDHFDHHDHHINHDHQVLNDCYIDHLVLNECYIDHHKNQVHNDHHNQVPLLHYCNNHQDHSGFLDKFSASCVLGKKFEICNLVIYVA